MNEKIREAVQSHLGYNDEEMAFFLKDPRNTGILEKAPEIMTKTLIAEIVESHGCNSRHKVGDRLVLDGGGNLLSGLCPDRMCVYAVSSIKHVIFAVQELMYAGVDPNELKFKRTSCCDVGLQCGGWGRVVLEIKVEDRKP